MRRAAIASVLLAVLALAGLVTGCARTPAKVSARLVLPSYTITAGHQLSGQVIIDNQTGHALHFRGCGSPVNVTLSNGHYHPTGAGAACAGTATVPTGQTTYPVKVEASYLSCSVGHADGNMPRCAPGDQPPPLPPGTYQASLSVAISVAQAPPPVIIHVTETGADPATSAASPAGSLTTPAPVTSPATRGGAPVTARLALPSRTLTSGQQMSVRVIVDNRSGHALRVRGCQTLFGAALWSRTYHPGVAVPSCAQQFTVPTGESSYRIPVQATYLACSMSHPTASDPKCLPSGEPGLSPGQYRVVVVPDSSFVAAPAPITVRVTRS
jgi:hypothetical protein